LETRIRNALRRAERDHQGGSRMLEFRSASVRSVNPKRAVLEAPALA